MAPGLIREQASIGAKKSTQSIQIVSRLTFLISSLVIRLIQSFIQNITFLLCIGLLIKVLQE